jgi:hypothetical protein
LIKKIFCKLGLNLAIGGKEGLGQLFKSDKQKKAHDDLLVNPYTGQYFFWGGEGT